MNIGLQNKLVQGLASAAGIDKGRVSPYDSSGGGEIRPIWSRQIFAIRLSSKDFGFAEDRRLRVWLSSLPPKSSKGLLAPFNPPARGTPLHLYLLRFNHNAVYIQRYLLNSLIDFRPGTQYNHGIRFCYI